MRFELSLITCGRPRMTLITGDLFILSLFLLQLLPAHALGYILAGTVATCDNEGEKVDIPFTLGNPCLNCECKNREVICIQNKCPAKMKNCGLVVRSPEECCGHCRECVLDGIVHNTSTSSSLINSSSCTLYSCQGGVLTKSTRRCVVPCTDPLKVHSRCCPLCPGCSFNGLEYKDGQHFSLHNDPCIKCRCLDRMVQCERNMCPLLPCFPNATYIPEGECCPRCNDQVRISDLQDGTCLLHNKVYRDGESINIDNCTSCVCKGSTMVCFHHCRKNGSCRAPENCCHMCVSYVQPLETHCRVNNSIYQDGDQLPSSPCMTCNCRTGKTKCQRFKCPTRKVCPHGQHLEQTQLECCPKCVNKPGVCTVFGDPHYRTFDGKTFNFQGPCRYTLVRDCTRAELFSVIVQNDARNTHYFAWTKAVELWLGPTTIELLPRLRLRFNGSHAVLPLVTPSLNITTSGFLLKVSTSIGLTVTWDGKSYAEVAMTSRWRSRVCGLCGNYNGHYRDELLGQNGYFHADVESFAESWRVDDNEVCARPTRSRLPNVCTGSGKKRRRARRLCRKLISWGFHKCHAIVDLLPFYKSCMMDMCECPKKQRCYCEAFLAYTRACEREGVRIRWDVKQRCHGLSFR